MRGNFKMIGALLAAAVFFNLGGSAFAQDKYAVLASEIAEAGSAINNKKIAIIPFSYADGRAATKDGSVVSERITMKLIRLKKFEIVERSMLDKVMGELKLQNSGGMDVASTQQLGKLLGVEAIVTGTLVEMQGGKIEVNARLIKTETAQAIGSSQVTVEKDWVGDAATPYQPQTQAQAQQQAQPTYYQQATYSQPAAAAPRERSPYQYGFFEVFYGFGSPNMKLEFSNSNNNIVLDNTYTNELGINYWPTRPYPLYPYVHYHAGTVTFDKLSTAGYGPIAMRIGGFSNTVIGGDMEFSYESRHLLAQDPTSVVDGNSAAVSLPDSYATVKTFGISFDLLLRVPTKMVDPYTGVGFGLSMNTIDLPEVWGVGSIAPASEYSLGYILRVPLGVRIRLDNHICFTAEARYEVNSMSFTRGFQGEDDSIVLSGMKVVAGMGLTF